MYRKTILISALLLVTNVAVSQTVEIDNFWTEMSRTVAEGNFKEYSAMYHPDAILVEGISKTSYPISQALAGWKQGFDNTKAGTMKAGVEFRFSERLHSENTAHDTGIFKYSWQSEGEEMQSILIHFQGLLTKASGEWKMMMEYQISQATVEEWEALR